MTDSADQLAAAIRAVINEAVSEALRTHIAPTLPTPVEDIRSERATERMLYPLKEVQHRLSISRSTVYQLVGDGRLSSVKIGSRRFVTAAALDAYVQGLRPE